LQKNAESIAAKKYAVVINECLTRKKWTQNMLYVHANILSDNGEEIFSHWSLQKWLLGSGLPKIEAVVAMSEALKAPELIAERVSIVKELYQIKEDTCYVQQMPSAQKNNLS